jgi:hypothetical protein
VSQPYEFPLPDGSTTSDKLSADLAWARHAAALAPELARPEASTPGPVWNVRVAVVMNLRAPDGPAAIRKLDRALRAAGFEPLTDAGSDYADAFEAEDGTEPEQLPFRGRH